MSRMKNSATELTSVISTAPRSRWSTSYGTELTGRAYIDEADHTASQMEAKWGAGRLRLLVGPELREKFDRQRYLFNQAVWHGDLEDVRLQAGRMVKAWLALNRAAEAEGRVPQDPSVWEIVLGNGVVAAIVPDIAHAMAVQSEGRKVAVYTLDEIGRLLSASKGVIEAKVIFPGATVVRVDRDVSDPLDGVGDTAGGLDDALPF